MVYESLIIKKIKKALATKPSFGLIIIFAILAWLINSLLDVIMFMTTTCPELLCIFGLLFFIFALLCLPVIW